jgi:hypothetical protein
VQGFCVKQRLSFFRQKRLPVSFRGVMTFPLSEDLVAIRKFRKLTVRDIYDSTRIPLEVIEEIESGYVFTPECQRNKTYVRSFVRTYAKALRISEADATHALDLVERQAYDGFIRRVYLPGAETSTSSSQGAQAPVPPATSAPPAPIRTEPRITAARASTLMDYKDEVSRPDPTRPHNKATPPPPDPKSINWVDMGNRLNTFSVGLKNVYRAAGVLIILAAAFGIYKFWPILFGENVKNDPKLTKLVEPAIDTLQVPAPDTTALQPVIVEPKEKPALAKLDQSDSIRVLIYANTDKVEGVRVRPEGNDLISPYWIEKGDAMEFVFKDSLYIKGQFSRMVLLLNGHSITNWRDMRRNDGAIVLTRSYIEKHPEWLSPRPKDSLTITPKRVIPRPIFKKNKPS